MMPPKHKHVVMLLFAFSVAFTSCSQTSHLSFPSKVNFKHDVSYEAQLDSLIKQIKDSSLSLTNTSESHNYIDPDTPEFLASKGIDNPMTINVADIVDAYKTQNKRLAKSLSLVNENLVDIRKSNSAYVNEISALKVMNEGFYSDFQKNNNKLAKELEHINSTIQNHQELLNSFSIMYEKQNYAILILDALNEKYLVQENPEQIENSTSISNLLSNHQIFLLFLFFFFSFALKILWDKLNAIWLSQFTP